MIASILGFLTTTAGKALVGTTVAASALGLHAAEVIDIPVIPDSAEEAPDRSEVTDSPEMITSDENELGSGEEPAEDSSQIESSEEPDEPQETDLSEVDPSDGLDETELAALCQEAANHGQYVSQVAKSRPADDSSDTYSNHGQWVSQAAQTECGKTEPEPDTDTEPTTAELDDDGVAKRGPGVAKPKGPGKARGVGPGRSRQALGR